MFLERLIHFVIPWKHHMELRQLRYFVAVAEHGNFSRAAKSIHLTQPALSRQVKSLEEELGVDLFERGKNVMSLTSLGKIFLREAREVLAHMEQAVQTTLRAANGDRGKLSVGLCGPAVTKLLPEMIREFRARNPGITLTIKDLEPARQPEALAEGIIDIGFTRRVPPEYDHLLGSEVFFQEPLIAALPAGHPLATRRMVQPSQLAKEPFILYHREGAPELFDAVIALCRRAKFAPHIGANPNRWQSVLTLVEAGEGVSLVPASARHLRSNGVVFRALGGRGRSVDVVLAWRKDKADPIRDRFLKKLRQSRPKDDAQMFPPSEQSALLNGRD